MGEHGINSYARRLSRSAAAYGVIVDWRDYSAINPNPSDRIGIAFRHGAENYSSYKTSTRISGQD